MLKHSFSIFSLIFFNLVFLVACNSTHPIAEQLPEMLDAAYPEYYKQPIETEKQIFAIDEDMITFVNKSVANQASEKAKLTHLAHAIFDRTELSLSYRAGANTTAKETFYGGTANCLSLTIMAYSMTQHLRLKSVFQDVEIPEYWTRRNGNTLINRHINLKVHPSDKRRYLLSNSPIVIDFDPQDGMQKFKATELTKSQMVSFYYTNKAADFLISEEPNKAYAYLRAAVKQDPKNEGAWLNLGVFASQHQFYSQAKSYYEMAISLRPEFSTAYENLAMLYTRQGMNAKAQGILRDLHKKRIDNPYYHMVKGDIALEKDLYELAIKHYKKAISLNKSPHEFHFSIAKAYFKMGDIKNAHRYLKNAKRRAGDVRLSEQYALKISTLLASK